MRIYSAVTVSDRSGLMRAGNAADGAHRLSADSPGLDGENLAGQSGSDAEGFALTRDWPANDSSAKPGSAKAGRLGSSGVARKSGLPAGDSRTAGAESANGTGISIWV